MKKRNMQRAAFIVLMIYVNLSIAAETVSTGSIISLDPDLESRYDTTCDLDYSDLSVFKAARVISEKYDTSVSVPSDVMDIHFKLEGDEKDVLQYLSDVFIQHVGSFVFVIQTEGEGNRRVGLEGPRDMLKDTVEYMKKRFKVSDIQTGQSPAIRLKGSQVPCWEAIGQLARQSNLGLAFLHLERNNRNVLAYQKAGPFYLYLSKEATSGKLVLDLLYKLEVTTDVWDVEIKDVQLRYGDRTEAVPGCTLTTTDENPKCAGRVEWVSDEAVRWEAGMMVEGAIQGPLLTREYEVKELTKGAAVRDDELAVRVRPLAGDPDFKSLHGAYFEPDEVRGEWINVTIDILNNLNEEEKAFLRRMDEKRLAHEPLSNDESRRRNALAKEKMAVIEVVSLGKPPVDHDYITMKYGGVYYRNTITGIEQTHVLFDSIQDGEEIFPLYLELRKYEPKKINFSVTLR